MVGGSGFGVTSPIFATTLGSFLAFGTNLATQGIQGVQSGKFDFNSALISAVAAAFGTYAGNIVARNFHIPTKVIGNSLSHIAQSEVRSDAIISNAAGGILGGGGEILAQYYLLDGPNNRGNEPYFDFRRDHCSGNLYMDYYNPDFETSTPIQ